MSPPPNRLTGLAARGVCPGPSAEKRALAELGAAGVALPVLGDIGRTRSRGIQTGDYAAVAAQHLAVHRHHQSTHGESGVHPAAERHGEDRPWAVFFSRSHSRLLSHVSPPTLLPTFHF